MLSNLSSEYGHRSLRESVNYILITVLVVSVHWILVIYFFFFQAEDGIRDLVRSRGLGDVYKRQDYWGI